MRESAYWVSTVELLEECRFISKSVTDDIYKLTSDGWTNAGYYIDSNNFTEDELIDSNKLVIGISEEQS